MTKKSETRGNRWFQIGAALAVMALGGLALAAGSSCGGDVCDDLLMEEQACADYTSPVAPAGESCTDTRGEYVQCVLDSSLDLCKALVTKEAGASEAMEAKCGATPD